MQDVADQSAAPITIGADLCAIFISLELSRSIWLATSLSPGSGEKMSKHSVSVGDTAALLARFSELGRRACARTGKSFPIIVIQEAGLDGFWIHRVLLSEGIESHVVDAASIATSRRRVGSRPTGSMARLARSLVLAARTRCYADATAFLSGSGRHVGASPRPLRGHVSGGD
jgi:transposase